MTTEQINQLIAQYGRPAFELAMKQVYINATLSIIAGLIALVGAAILGILTVRIYRRWKAFTGPSYDTMDDLNTGLLGGATVIVSLIAVLFLSGATALLNPEFAALHLLISGSH